MRYPPPYRGRVEGDRAVDGTERRPPRVGKRQTVFHTFHNASSSFQERANPELQEIIDFRPQILRRRRKSKGLEVAQTLVAAMRR
jgi:hypothetical protein